MPTIVDPAMLEALDGLSEAEIDAAAAIFAAISYREHEFGRSTEILFRRGDPQTALHFRMGLEALKVLARGDTAASIGAHEEPYFDQPKED